MGIGLEKGVDGRAQFLSSRATEYMHGSYPQRAAFPEMLAHVSLLENVKLSWSWDSRK